MKYNQAIILWLSVFILLFFSCSIELFSQEKPNVLVIFADELGYGDLSCYGAQDVNTPHINQLADEGLRYTNFLVPASVCSWTECDMGYGVGMYWYGFRETTSNRKPDPEGVLVSPSLPESFGKSNND